MAPESYDSLPPGFVEGIFHKVTEQEIKAPVTRDLFAGDYDLKIANGGSTADEGPLSESDFLSTADLREP